MADDSKSVAAGDVVCLQSGGPLMTVQSVDATHVNCIYAHPDGDVRHVRCTASSVINGRSANLISKMWSVS